MPQELTLFSILNLPDIMLSQKSTDFMLMVCSYGTMFILVGLLFSNDGSCLDASSSDVTITYSFCRKTCLMCCSSSLTLSVTRPVTQYVTQTGSRTERNQHLNPPTSLHWFATNSEPSFRAGIYDGCPKPRAKLTIFQSKSIGKVYSCLWLVLNKSLGDAASPKNMFSRARALFF